jgi:4-amino-4-deoxy-L-arabinose transferase-like glycosyltransferase
MRRRLLILTILALALRLAAVFAIREYERPNVWESGVIARALVEGRGFAFDWRAMLGPAVEPDRASTWWPPLYPLFLASCHVIAPGAPYLAANLAQAALSALVPLFLFVIGRRLFGEREGWIAGVLAAVHPPLLGFSALIQTAILEIFCTTLAILLFVIASGWRPSDAPRRARDGDAMGALDENGARGLAFAAMGGAATALAALTRPPALALLAIAPVAWQLGGHTLRRTALLSLAALLGVAALIAPWTARNHRVRGEWVLISSNGGWNLFLGNNPEGTADRADVGRAVPPELRQRLLGMNEVEGDSFLRALAIDYIRENPGAAARRVLARARNLIWFNPEFGSSSGYSSALARWTRPVYMLTWALLLGAAVAGMALTRRAWRRLVLLYGAIAANAAVILATFFVNRYRAPIEPILILFAAAAVARWARRDAEDRAVAR